MKMLFAALILALSFGCASIENNPNTAGLIGFAATNEFIKKLDTDEERAARAHRIVVVAETAKAVADGESITVAIVEQAVRDAIQWDELNAADQYQVEMLITLIGDEVESRVGAGILEETALTAVDVILDNVIMAAKLYE